MIYEHLSLLSLYVRDIVNFSSTCTRVNDIMPYECKRIINIRGLYTAINASIHEIKHYITCTETLRSIRISNRICLHSYAIHNYLPSNPDTSLYVENNKMYIIYTNCKFSTSIQQYPSRWNIDDMTIMYFAESTEIFKLMNERKIPIDSVYDQLYLCTYNEA